jgi:hypothetical protein
MKASLVASLIAATCWVAATESIRHQYGWHSGPSFIAAFIGLPGDVAAVWFCTWTKTNSEDAFFIIAGAVNCPFYFGVIRAAMYLKRRLAKLRK